MLPNRPKPNFSHGVHGEIKRSLSPDRQCVPAELTPSPLSGMISFMRMIFQERGVIDLQCNVSLFAPSNFLLKILSPVCCATPGLIVLSKEYSGYRLINPGVFGIMPVRAKWRNTGGRNDKIEDLEIRWGKISSTQLMHKEERGA